MELKRPRILAFDLIRGLFLAVIAVNHLAISFGPSILLVLTGASQLPASAAEGFFLISGIMVGYVYGPKILMATKSTFLKLWKRAGLLWLLSVLFTLLFTIWALNFPDSEKYATLYSRDGISFLYNTFLLHFSFGWADFLSRYAWFMFLTPFALWLIAKRLAWIVALGSFVVWGIFRSTDQLLPFSAWQIIFITGTIIGYYFPSINRYFSNLPKKVQYILTQSVIWVSITTFIVALLGYTIIPLISQYVPSVLQSPLATLISPVMQAISTHIDKPTLDPLRMIIGLLWFTGLFLIISRNESSIDKLTKGTLLLFGRNSLYVYCLSAVLLFIIDMYIRPAGGSKDLLSGSLLAVALLTVIYFLTKYKRFLVTIFLWPFRRILRV
jgi:hypothetical protein